MRIVHLVANATLTGAADPAIGLARGQQALGHDVSVGIDGLRAGNLAAKLATFGLPRIDGLHLCTKGSLAQAWADRARIRALAASADVVHVHGSHEHTLAGLAGVRARLVRSIHHPRGCRRRGLQGALYGRTAAFFVPARAYAEQLVEAYPALADRPVTVAPGAVDVDRFTPGLDRGALRAEQGIEPDAFVVGLVARIKPGRGHRLFLEALAQVRRARPDVIGALVGKGEGVPEIEGVVDELGLGPGVRWYGFRDADLPLAYASCDVTVLLEEGNDAGCRAVLESMACGVPVIGAAHPAIEEALAEGGGGALIAVRDRAQLVAAIEAAAAWSADERARRGALARARIVERHTDRARAERVLARYPRGAAR